MRRLIRFALGAALAATLGACGGSDGNGGDTPALGPTPKADCGPGSRPETGLQGRVSAEDHASGRAAAGYTCNTELVGSYTTPTALGSVGGFKVQRYVDQAGRECAYYDTTTLFPTNLLEGQIGVNVIDMSDPSNPVLARRLVTPAMLSPHESLLVSQEAGVLAAVFGNVLSYPGIVDVYDLKEYCRNPQLRSSALTGVLGHESGMSPDGKTFYTSSVVAPTLTAVDISDPSNPRRLLTTNYRTHGLSISADGNRAFLASASLTDTGLVILDVSDIQARKPDPEVREISRLTWDNMSIPQNAIPFTRDGKPYVLEFDEFASDSNTSGIPAANGQFVGAARIIDIADETQPRVISALRLEVHEPEHRQTIADDPGAGDITGGYAAHYCDLPTRVDPDIAACTMILSGLRVFDIRDPARPREVAYFNAPVQMPGGAVSSPAFVPERKEIWYSDANSGFYVVRVTNGAW
ncbi:LVIVD repeat-containing protein [Sinimarinibacterium thermocellulolyticum]|uniref:LVIVD repeat-containing protein n=1 Tax=Sinimarinibacterium thermocellulolyticum TaxID=3170016 RepID=A0ABV2A674_9GAMM